MARRWARHRQNKELGGDRGHPGLPGAWTRRSRRRRQAYPQTYPGAPLHGFLGRQGYRAGVRAPCSPRLVASERARPSLAPVPDTFPPKDVTPTGATGAGRPPHRDAASSGSGPTRRAVAAPGSPDRDAGAASGTTDDGVPAHGHRVGVKPAIHRRPALRPQVGLQVTGVRTRPAGQAPACGSTASGLSGGLRCLEEARARRLPPAPQTGPWPGDRTHGRGRVRRSGGIAAEAQTPPGTPNRGLLSAKL
jgi:hypothetical protein